MSNRYNSGVNESWAIIVVDHEHRIKELNDRATYYFPNVQIGDCLTRVFPWFKDEWLTGIINSRVAKALSPERVFYLEIAPGENLDGITLFLRNVEEFRNTAHLLCEAEHSIIKLQSFIDNFHEGIVITNSSGIVRVVNQAFYQLAGTIPEKVFNYSVYDLVKEENVPYRSIAQVLRTGKPNNDVIKFRDGREAFVSSTPLFDRQGNILRVFSSIRDVSEIEQSREQLRSAEQVAQYCRRKLNANLAENNGYFSQSTSRKMEDLHELVKNVAFTDVTLLINGESGVGKTSLAKYIHTLSPRGEKGNFVHITCSAIPETLLESELFGHEAGSFSGADKPKAGLFEIACGGTVLLDEIGDMPLTLQAKILNVLQEKKVYRVGGTKSINIDVRLLAATNKDPATLVANGQFRQDLYFRLNVVPIVIPPLRERKEDIAILIAHYLKDYNIKHHKNKGLSAEAMKFSWIMTGREILGKL